MVDRRDSGSSTRPNALISVVRRWWRTSLICTPAAFCSSSVSSTVEPGSVPESIVGCDFSGAVEVVSRSDVAAVARCWREACTIVVTAPPTATAIRRPIPSPTRRDCRLFNVIAHLRRCFAGTVIARNWGANRALKIGEARFKFGCILEVGRLDLERHVLRVEQVEKIGAVVLVGRRRGLERGFGLGPEGVAIERKVAVRGPGLDQRFLYLQEDERTLVVVLCPLLQS